MTQDPPDWQDQPLVAFGLMALFIVLIFMFLAGCGSGRIAP